MANVLDEISQKIDTVLLELAQLKKAKSTAPLKLSFAEFCHQYGITRPTGYAWAARGLIQLEKIGGRNFVPVDSISVSKKYQRNESNH